MYTSANSTIPTLALPSTSNANDRPYVTCERTRDAIRTR
jgi:hypothetical protein